MRTKTTFAAIAMCASLYLTTGPAQAALTMNGLYPNGLIRNGAHLNGLRENGVHLNGVLLNGAFFNGTKLNDEPTPEVQRESLPFNGLSQKGLGKTQP